MRLLILSLLFVFSFNLSSSQEDNYKGLLTDFIKAQGQFETFNATIDQMTSMMGITLNEDEKVEFTSDVMSSLIEMLVPVYQKHFTEQDLKDAIDLFKTPIGKKISEKSPIIAQESMQASMQWGMELSTKLQKYMK
ncbi:MAG: DUF2059 domain-containing protein [Bacteroidota bacterium]|jgi:hypothetical protein|nr:DUF2059 domain-containing protein [Bacteroidota bacterium]